jgi:8-oxo-dGTP pyrophosphatase MutT (NUDIX family)
VPHIHELIDFTVAIFVVHESRVLVIHHRKLDKWLPLGGHIELDEEPESAALREAKEESGLDVGLMGERPPTTELGTRALIAPRFLDIHRISDTHEHIGLIYFARVKGGSLDLAAEEHNDIRWVTAEELDALQPPMSNAVKWYCRQALTEVTAAVTANGRGIAPAAGAVPEAATASAVLAAVELAAGGLVWGQGEHAGRLLLIHRPHRSDWSLPKGKVDAGESPEAAAVREVREETGVTARLVRLASPVHYPRGVRLKVVLYWHMQAVEVPAFRPNAEVDKLLWATPTEALARLTHETERELVRRETAAAVSGAGRNARLDRLWAALAVAEAQATEPPALAPATAERLAASRTAAALLDKARAAAAAGNVDLGWSWLHEVDRVRVVNLADGPLLARVLSLEEEAEAKLKDWRREAVKRLLVTARERAKAGGPLPTEIRPAVEAAVQEAVGVLNAQANNRYHQLRVIGDNLRRLVVALAAVLGALLGLFAFCGVGSRWSDGDWSTLAGVALFGALCGGLSAIFQFSRPAAVEIPDALLRGWMTLGRPLIGAVSALFIYMALRAELIPLLTLKQSGAPAYYAFAFLAGFSERLFFSAVGQVAGRRKPEPEK